MSTQETSSGSGLLGGGSGGEGSTGAQAREAGQQAREAAQQAAGQARSRVRQEIDNRTTQVGEQISSNAQDVRGMAEELRNQGKEGLAGVVERGTERAEQTADYLKSADADRLKSDLENLARERPWAVIVGGLTMGFAASRLLKASSGDRGSEAQGSYRSEGQGGYSTDVAAYPPVPASPYAGEATGSRPTAGDVFEEPVAPVAPSSGTEVVIEDETSIEAPYRDDSPRTGL